MPLIFCHILKQSLITPGQKNFFQKTIDNEPEA